MVVYILLPEQEPFLLGVSSPNQFLTTASKSSSILLSLYRKVSHTVLKLPFLVPILVLVKKVYLLWYVQELNLLLTEVLRVPMEQMFFEDNFQKFFFL